MNETKEVASCAGVFFAAFFAGGIAGAWLLGYNYLKNRKVALWVMEQIGRISKDV